MSDAIADLINNAVASGNVAGAIALVARGTAVQLHVAGHQHIETRTPMRLGTMFRVRSMTKPVLAAAAMMLVEDSRLGLDDPLDPWLPELAHRQVLRDVGGPLDDTVPANRAITLRDLLTMRMGLGAVVAADDSPIQRAIIRLGLNKSAYLIGISPDEFMARLGSLPLADHPGERFHYHTGSDVTAVLVARIAAMPIERFLEERLFAPLGMRDTGFHVPADKIDRLATAYVRDRETGMLAIADPARDGSYARPQIFPSELVSTADDYLAFARMIAAGGEGPHGRILDEASVTAMLRDEITPDQKAASSFGQSFWSENGWGLGGSVVTRRDGPGFAVGSYGWLGCLGSSFVVDPQRDHTAILLTQRLMMAADDLNLVARFQALAGKL